MPQIVTQSRTVGDTRLLSWSLVNVHVDLGTAGVRSRHEREQHPLPLAGTAVAPGPLLLKPLHAALCTLPAGWAGG